MKNRLSDHGVARFFTQPIHGKGSNNIPELMKPQLERTEIELENILRWGEDDGGQTIEYGNAVDQLNPDIAQDAENE